MTYEHVFNTAKDIRLDMENMTGRELSDKYNEFKEKYPKLYEYVTTSINDEYDEGLLEKMLVVKTNIDNGTMNKLSGEVVFGEILAKKYIYTHIDEPSLEEKKIALEKIIKRNNTT